MYERNIFLPPSGPAPGVLQTKASLLRCADKHRICDSVKNQRQKQAQTPSGQALVSHTVIRVPLTGQCLLRCAQKHCVSALKTKDKSVKAMCLLHCAYKHKSIKTLKSKANPKRALGSPKALRASSVVAIVITSAILASLRI